jgi:chromosome segregation ATPase
MELMISVGLNAALLMFIFVLIRMARKYRKLCRVAHAEASARPVEKAAIIAPVKEDKTPEPPIKSDPELSSENEPEQPADPARESARINKLLKVINFQKSKIAELMQIKDTLESSRKKLGDLPVRSRLQHDRLKALSESQGLTDEAGKPLAALEEDMGELVSYVLLLEKEEIRLVGKYKEWEEDLKTLMEGEDLAMTEIGGLEARLKEAEEQLKVREQELADVKTQMEGLDKEYMTLYHQQQAQAQQGIDEVQKEQGTP